tara:strand:+ start:319 stop:528 length:210 start_codon:yes stop_codon:yes gene_type:complete
LKIKIISHNLKKEGSIMKTYKIIRYEKIKEIQIVQADNEEQAEEKMKYENWEDCEVLSSETEIEEINKA